MTEHEDLIARLRAVVDVALMDASAASSEFDCSASDYAATEAHRRELEAVRDELIAALEKVTAERDAALRTMNDHECGEQAERAYRRAEKAEAERDEALKEADRSAQERGRLIEERDQLAAVIREALGVARSGSVPLGAQEARHFDRLLAETRRALNEAPSVALDRVKAEALREAAEAFEGGAINVEIFGNSAETRYWQGANEARGNLVASLRDRADRIEKGESNDQ